MKKSALLIVIPCLILSGCKTQQKATTENYDDVYYSKPKLAQSANNDAGSSQDLSAPKYVTPPDSSSSVKSGSASSKEDNSDYSYSARLKRFHDPVGKLGYYDNYYTNNPNSDSTSGNQTVNVYAGSGWDPFSSMNFGLGYGGWGYGGFGYGGGGFGWGYPYDWYYPYSYWGPGCYCCGYYGYYPYWDYGYGFGFGNNYYGRRSTLSSNDGNGRRNLRSNEQSSVSDQTRNNNGTSSGRDSRSAINPPYSRTGEATRSIAGNGTTNGTNITPSQRGTINSNPQPIAKRTPADQQRYNYKKNNAQKSSPYPRNTSKNNQGQRAVPRYAKPEYSTPSRAGQAQIYSSPAYRQPKSSQEYISPRTQDVQNSGNNSTNRSYSSPSNNVRRSGTGNNTRTYSSPSNNSRNTYTAPSRSFTPSNSSPSRTNNYSAPSRSGGGSYSAPSRSGNSGGGNNNSGSSGGGRRK